LIDRSRRGSGLQVRKPWSAAPIESIVIGLIMTTKETVESVTKRLIDDPSSDTVHQPYSAYNQGFAAFGLRVRLKDNPYKPGMEFDFWDMGWKDARNQDDDDTGGVYSPLEQQWEATAKEQLSKSR
jgi:hypothetical protein